MSRFLPDPFILALLATVLLATALPVDGTAALHVGQIATAAVVLLFFLHGVRLPRENLVAALVHWRLHLLILCTTFAFIPLAGTLFSHLLPGALPGELWAGVLFLCALPSTVQNSIAYTSIARGNVAAAVASAAASNLLGIALTPVIAGLLLHTQDGEVPLSGIWKVVLQLLLPFVVGHAMRPWLADWALRQRKLLTYSDRLTVLLSVYVAFSAAVIGGIWSSVPVATLLVLVLVCAALLCITMLWCTFSARTAGFTGADARSVLYCGSQKSLVSGVPMARVLFPSAEIGAIILPIMIYHQLQLMIGAAIARRQGQATEGST